MPTFFGQFFALFKRKNEFSQKKVLTKFLKKTKKFVQPCFCSKKMLKKLFGSGARVKLLRQFLQNPKEEFFIRELTRILNEQINSLRRELENLEKIGLLKSKERNRKKYYFASPHFPLLHELTSIVRKTDESYLDLLKKISKLGEVDVLVLSGQFIDQPAEIDLLLVGSVASKDLESFLEANFPGKDIKYSLMSREDFLYRITLKDKFVSSIFGQKDNVWLKNKLKKDTEPLLQN